MFLPTHFPQGFSDRLLALASAMVVAGVLMATAIVPASPAVAAPAEFSPIAMGVLA
ncbi:MAG: hypothetical protein AAFQ13_04110 [Pseudomonadota bacterium]